jgi:CARDB
MWTSMVHVALLAALAISPASASLLECERGTKPAAEFEARMNAVPGAARMQMRFTLQASAPGRRAWRRVAAPGFDAWTTADPGTTRYVYTRRVEALLGPAQYRTKVRFRWQDADGRLVARTVRFSRACRVADVRPNLTIRDLSIEAEKPSRSRYVAVVRNTGRGAAGAFDVQVGSAEPVTVDALAPGRERTVEVVGPPCDAPVTAIADPTDAVDERSETDNELTVDC